MQACTSMFGLGLILRPHLAAAPSCYVIQISSLARAQRRKHISLSNGRKSPHRICVGIDEAKWREREADLHASGVVIYCIPSILHPQFSVQPWLYNSCLYGTLPSFSRMICSLKRHRFSPSSSSCACFDGLVTLRSGTILRGSVSSASTEKQR